MTSNQLKRMACTTRATDFSTATIGGAVSTSELTGATVGETLFEMPSTAEGSGDGARVQRGKEFLANTSSDDLGSAKIYFPNWLADFGAGTDTIVLIPLSPEDEGKVFRLIGFDVDGDPISLAVTLGSGAETVSGDLLSDLQRATVHDPETEELAALVGAVFIERGNGTPLGEIPPGFFSATAELDAWAAATLNDSATATSAAADPSGASWTRARTLATALNVATGTLSAGAAQGYWLRLTVKEGMPASPDVEYAVTIEGNDLG